MSNTPRPTRYSSLSLKDVVYLCAGPCDDEAWEEFVSPMGKPIGLIIMRTASLWGEPSRSLVEDLTQVTYLRLWESGCRLLRDFAIQRGGLRLQANSTRCHLPFTNALPGTDKYKQASIYLGMIQLGIDSKGRT